jgi:hypothetical protein
MNEIRNPILQISLHIGSSAADVALDKLVTVLLLRPSVELCLGVTRRYQDTHMMS